MITWHDSQIEPPPQDGQWILAAITHGKTGELTHVVVRWAVYGERYKGFQAEGVFFGPSTLLQKDRVLAWSAINLPVGVESKQ